MAKAEQAGHLQVPSARALLATTLLEAVNQPRQSSCSPGLRT